MAARWNTAQRVVLSVAAGLALAVLGRTIDCWTSAGDGGWSGYAPNTGLSIQEDVITVNSHPLLRLVMWLLLIGAWAWISLRLFSDRADPRPQGPDLSPPTEPRS